MQNYFRLYFAQLINEAIVYELFEGKWLNI